MKRIASLLILIITSFTSYSQNIGGSNSTVTALGGFTATKAMRPPQLSSGAAPFTGGIADWGQIMVDPADSLLKFRYRGAWVSLANSGGSGFVPYFGATSNVTLGTHTLTAGGITINGAPGPSILTMSGANPSVSALSNTLTFAANGENPLVLDAGNNSATVGDNYKVIVNAPNIGPTTAAGVVLQNLTPGTGIAENQYSPSTQYISQGWNSGTNHEYQFEWYNVAIGSADGAAMNLDYKRDGVTNSSIFTIAKDGSLVTEGSILANSTITGTGSLYLNGATSGSVRIAVPASVTSYSVALPSAQGALNQAQINDGSGNLSWKSVALTPSVNVFTVNQTIQRDGLAATPAVGLTLQNTTTATSGVPNQYPPYISLLGNTYNNTTGVTSGWRISPGSTRQATIVRPFLNFDYTQDGSTYATLCSLAVTTTGTLMSCNNAAFTMAYTTSTLKSTINNSGDFTLGCYSSCTAVPVFGIQSTTGLFTQTVPTSTSSYGIVWPNAQGAANTAPVNDGSGNLSWLQVPIIRATGRATDQTAANSSVSTYTVGAADASFEISANVLVTTSGSEAFTVQCTYTDEGNTARTETMPFVVLAGTTTAAIAFANGAVPYHGAVIQIRAKAASEITIKTQAAGTYTGCTYNVQGIIKQVTN